MCMSYLLCFGGGGKGGGGVGKKAFLSLSVPPVLLFAPVQCDPVPHHGGTSHLTSACLQEVGWGVPGVGCPYGASTHHPPN